ncbi:hypothetical protein BOTBODRAFT_31259 [Botryobasidium botryosum FD-172 SS1]|uniref:G domain-containing protein n=1 Tax=Botryobasidium botryosum (strain FD-172 SS1) TaxID=930990 RepID=A0A067MM29_BOTB1|nr:hypothetical protein BOTBODRAFT_31259 [Botryobasidium botryosum FD-172 SS1]
MEDIARPDEFRILIIGRANAGKTTILRAVCGAEGDPDVYGQDGRKIKPGVGNKARSALRSIRAQLLCGAPESLLAPDPQVVPIQGPALQLADAILSPSPLRGEHNIEYSLRFPTSPGFVFHDSRGFESGAVEELELVREFIRKKATLGSVKNQLHAIWYCFSTDSNRFMTAADKEFFNTIDTGTVPVIAIFTKFDALDAIAFRALSEQGVPFAEAQRQAPEHAQAQFDQDLLPLIQQLAHPPRVVVCIRNMHNKGSPATIQKAAELIERTGAALDDDALKVLLVQAQRVNVELCIKAAVDSGIITKTAQDALQEDSATFNPLKKDLIQQIFKYFPFIWVGSVGWFIVVVAASAGDAFINTITPLITPLLHSMSPSLQILVVGCAAIIIAAKAFWGESDGDIQAPQITASSEHYIHSSTAEHVKVAILEAFQDTPGLYDTPEGRAALLQVILNNQMSIEDIENED